MGLSWSKSVAANELESMTDHGCYINSPQKKTAYEWHLNDKDNSALKKARRFHLQYEKLYVPRHWLIEFLLRSSAIIKDSAYAVHNGYLKDFDENKRLRIWKEISGDFKSAAGNSEPKHVLRAYSRSKLLSRQINNDMAKNTYHELKLYCTPLNCNVLARTHDGIQAFITILFHPKLKKYLCNEDITVYRGSVIDSESLLEGYEKGAIIITTTFLSTSRDLDVAKMFIESGFDSTKTNQVSVLCKYYIHNYRRTGLEMEELSQFPSDKEVLIYPYVPFRILSYTKRIIEQTTRQQIEVDLEEFGDDENNDSDRQSVWTVSTNV